MNAQAYVNGLTDSDVPAEGRAWLRRVFATQPAPIADALAAQHERVYRTGERKRLSNPMRPANVELREFVDESRWLIPLDADENQLRAWAKQRATECDASMRRVDGDELDTYSAGYMVASRFGLTPPKPSKTITLFGCIARLRCQFWWRRQARSIFGRRQERIMRSLGFVHKRAGLYISAAGFKRWRGRQYQNARTLRDSVAVCEDGTEYNLAEIAEKGVGNPSVRRSETMARIKGAERYADQRGDSGLFVTLTVPSELHAVDSRSLTPGAGRNVTPREAQQWLGTQWARARAKLHRNGIPVYGLRVAEPHHDGTPHWHLLLFAPPHALDSLTATLHDYFVNGSQDRARRKHACKIVAIDRSRGSATGYVAKYVAKAIDGYGLSDATTLDTDGYQITLGIDPEDSAQRVRAWASQWGIRQFQFVGLPPIGPWRELRRLARIEENQDAEALRQSADDGDYGLYITLMGGAAATAQDRPARVRYALDTDKGRYGEPKYRAYLTACGGSYTTRPLKWTIEYRPGQNVIERSGEAASTWTRGNNCTEAATVRSAAPIIRGLHSISATVAIKVKATTT